MARFKLVGIGEVLWDLLPSGRQLGGAPANFACHAHALGAEGRIISRVGPDDLGHEIIRRLDALGVPTDGVRVDSVLPTGTVTVAVTPDGQPIFTIHSNVAWDHLQADEASLAIAAGADAVCFGSLAQRLEPARSSIQALVAAAPALALRIFDVNLRQQFYSAEIITRSLQLANVLKLNDAELPVLAGLLGLRGPPRDQLQQLGVRFDLRLIAYTRGAHGSLLCTARQWADCPGIHGPVQDTVGAGDAFTAAMALGWLAGWDLDTINRRANEVAAYVCSCAGATPPLPPELRRVFCPVL